MPEDPVGALRDLLEKAGGRRAELHEVVEKGAANGPAGIVEQTPQRFLSRGTGG